MNIFWSEKKINEAIKRFNNGESIVAIARSMGGKAESLTRRLRNINPQKYRKINTIDIVIRFLKDNTGKYYKTGEIAKATDCSPQNISVAISREVLRPTSRLLKYNSKWGYNPECAYENPKIEIVMINDKALVIEHKKYVKSVLEEKERRIKANLWQLHA